jgi:hypothetical protein
MSLLCSVEVANLNKCNIFLEILNLAHEKLMNKIAGHGGGINIHGCQPYPGNCRLCTEISKRRTITQYTNYCSMEFNYLRSSGIRDQMQVEWIKTYSTQKPISKSE